MTPSKQRVAVCAALSMGTLFGGLGRGAAPQTPRLYEVTTELDMPHLEDNLRYAITREKRCLSSAQLHRLFPVIDHPALSGCRLGPESRDGESTRSELSCQPDHGTRGSALWQRQRGEEVGVLSVRLGGKNMTFTQRVTAHDLGACEATN